MLKDKKMKIVLASGSPRRRELLQQIGIEAEIIPSHYQEVMKGTDPQETVTELSVGKAGEVASRCGEDAVVIGADTVVAVQGRILGKPGSHQEAEEMIRLLSGGTHQVYTGVCFLYRGRLRSFTECTEVQVYPMTDEEIHSYAATEEPMDKAGAYGIQGRFARYIRGISGDYSNVVGLPAGRVYQELKRFLQEMEEL